MAYFYYIIGMKDENIIEKGRNYFMNIQKKYDQDGSNLRLKLIQK